MKQLFLLTSALVLSLSGTLPKLSAAVITVSMDSGNNGSASLFDQNNVALSPGTTADGDGFIFQLGYYDQATASNNFNGNWVALTGQGSANIGGDISGSSPAEALNQTSIGDLNVNFGATNVPLNTNGSGAFALSVTFDSTTFNTFNNLPQSTSIPLAIRFYNAYSLASATFYNTVSCNLWLWKTPSSPAPTPISISLDDPGLVWESTAKFSQASGSVFHTTITLVPEPSALGLAGVGCLAFTMIRRSRRKVRRMPPATS